MTGVQTCALPICFPVTILCSLNENGISESILRLKARFPMQFTYYERFDVNTLYEELRCSDTLLFPSNYENEASPLVVHEAQYAGVICLTSEAGTLTSEILFPGEANQKFLALDNLVKKIEDLATFKACSSQEYYDCRERIRSEAFLRGKFELSRARNLFVEE